MDRRRLVGLALLIYTFAALRLADARYEDNGSNPFCYRNIFNPNDEIASVERIAHQQATAEFVTSRMHWGQPYIVSGVTEGWLANYKWSHNYFRELFASHDLFSSTFSTPMSPDFSGTTPTHEIYYGIFLNSRDSAELLSADYSYPSFIPPEWRVTGAPINGDGSFPDHCTPRTL